MLRLERRKGSGGKYWELAVDGTLLEIRTGKIGSRAPPQIQRKRHQSIGAAQADATNKLKARLAKGYVEVARSDWSPAPPGVGLAPRNPELEAALYERIDGRTAWTVYADWLATCDTLWGERLALELDAPYADDPVREARLTQLRADHPERWYGPELARLRLRDDFGWMALCKLRYGFIVGIELRTAGLDNTDWGSPTLDQVLAALLRAPAARLLRDLRIHIDPKASERRLLGCIEALRAHGQLDNLRVLHFFNPRRWPVSERLGELDWLLERAPRLRVLHLHGQDLQFTRLVQPCLERLSLSTLGLPRVSIRALSQAQLPACVELGLGLGRWGPEAASVRAELAPLLDGHAAPRVRKLVLRNSDLGDELVDHLLASPLLPRLEELELSAVGLSDAGAREIITHADRVTHLKRLDLTRNGLSRASAGDLTRMYRGKGYARVSTHGQRLPDEYTKLERAGSRYWPQTTPPLP